MVPVEERLTEPPEHTADGVEDAVTPDTPAVTVTEVVPEVEQPDAVAVNV